MVNKSHLLSLIEKASVVYIDWGTDITQTTYSGAINLIKGWFSPHDFTPEMEGSVLTIKYEDSRLSIHDSRYVERYGFSHRSS